MARRPVPAVENDGFPVRPPLTPNDAARLAGTYVKPPRSEFLRLTVDLVDREELDGPDAVDRLRRFVQDWQRHAQAKMLVELGETLGFLVETIDGDPEEVEGREKRAKIVDEIIAMVPGFDEVDDLDADYLAEVMSFLNDLAEHHEVAADEGGLLTLRKKLIDDAPSADEADAEKASSEELRKELDAAQESLEAVKQQNAILRRDLQGLVNRIGHLNGEAARIAEDVFGATPVKG